MTLIDTLDAEILLSCLEDPKLGVLETSRRLRVARGTVQARLARLEYVGVLDWTPRIDPAGLGYPVQAFTALTVQQGRGVEAVREYLLKVPTVLEAFTITGDRDLICRIVARNHIELQHVLDRITATGLIARTNTSIVLTDELPLRYAALVRHSAGLDRPSSDGRVSAVRCTDRPRHRRGGAAEQLRGQCSVSADAGASDGA